MKKYWGILVALVIVASFLLGGEMLSVMAGDEPMFITKDEKRISGRTMEKLEEILKNQAVIMQDLKDIKTALAAIKK